MKVITYRPLSPDEQLNFPGAPFPVKALADAVLKNQSLQEALEELQKEGYRDEQGEKLFIGIKDLMEEVKKLKELLAALLPHDDSSRRKGSRQQLSDVDASLYYLPGQDGPPRSGKPMDGASLQALARLLSDASRKEKLTVREALMLTAHLRTIENLEKDLKRVYWGFDLESIDEGLLEEILGEDSLKHWQMIKDLAAHMVREGVAREGPSGLRLTSPGLQKIAWHILKEIFKPRKTDPAADRRQPRRSSEPPAAHETRPYRFGDPLHLDLSRSVLNAVKRAGMQLPVRISTQDFIVYDQEPFSRSATVLLLDVSKSMRFEDRYIAAKKVALALYELNRRRYPQDRVAVVTFSMEARKIRTEFLSWDETNPYTNMEAALDAARKTLALHKGFRRQIFLITDGEPTAHRERGTVFFQFPPHQKTLQRTLSAVESLARHKISLSVFLLSQEKSSIRFVDEMAKRAQGRVFHISPQDLGQCVLMDYIDKKRKYI
ncbi:MAG: VWA domain-containing protein [Proteobacteria bacterium]|nr:VWA domain-containing protein [Pseudomonadota bacterium]